MTTWDVCAGFLVIGSGGGGLVGGNLVGGNARSRSFESKVFDAGKLGALQDKLRPAIAAPLVMYTEESPQAAHATGGVQS